jgi:hypothetical protein
MAWTYTLPIATDTDRLRRLLRDTDSTRPLFQDEELEAALADHGGDVLRAAIECCELLAATGRPGMGSQVSEGAGGVQTSWSGIDYRTLAAYFRARLATQAGAGGLYAGGLSEAERLADAAEPDLRTPTFRLGQHDDPSGLTA